MLAVATNRAPAAAALVSVPWLPFASRYAYFLSVTLAAFAAGATLVPKKMQKALHPLVT